VFIVDGELLLGMMWRSTKALDLLRDPRVLVHSAVTNRTGEEGEFKVRGRAADVQDPGVRERYADTLEAAIDWRPPEPFHLFGVDIDDVAFVRHADERKHVATWKPDTGVVERSDPSP
jgi:hypothetical protein